MYLESVKIKKFRSIQEDNLLNCGNFNVLIGKNNSGKSNILSAIDAFFKCLKESQVLTLEPPIGKEIDFFQKEVNLPIIITLSFNLSTDERTALVEDIIADSPQMRNAVEGLSEVLTLIATLKVQASPKKFAYVSSLSLKPQGDAEDVERNIFSVDEIVALELFEKASRSRNALSESESLERSLTRVDEDIYRSIKSEGGRMSYSRGYFYASHENTEANRKIDTAIEDSSSFSDFRVKVQALITRTREELDSIATSPLKNKVGTFSGEESSIPNYVQNLLNKLSEMKVFYVRERRKEIGKEEAEQILSLKVQRGGTEKLSTIQTNVSDLLGVKIDAFQSTNLPRGESSAELDVDNFLVEVNGSGVREALRLILDVEFVQPNILLVEEPEVHLHPALEIGLTHLKF
jgi:AAA15 family ATPase/GTPase